MNNKTFKCVVAVPARLESKRLPKKVLMDIGGKSMIQRVLQQCSKAKNIDKVMYTCVYLLKKLKSESEILPDIEDINCTNLEENETKKYIDNQELVNYFKKNGMEDAEDKVRKENLDGEVLDIMEKGGWIELNIESDLKIAKIKKEIKNI